MKTIFSSGRHDYPTRGSFLLITVALIAGIVGCGGSGSAIKIRTWYDLDDIRNGMNLNYILMNDLNSTTAGYEELAGPAANGGKGWDPIGGQGFEEPFPGTFEGSGYEICDLFINRPDESDVGLFGHVGQRVVPKGEIRNLGVVNFTVTGERNVGGLVGHNGGYVSNSYSTGNVTGMSRVGGLTGDNWGGALVSTSYSAGSVSGTDYIGGLVGSNSGDSTVGNSYSSGSVIGFRYAGGLVGHNWGTVRNSYSTGNVAGNDYIGGLVGKNRPGTVSNCYATGNVTGNQDVGGLIGWIDSGTVNNSYSTGSVTGDVSVGGLVGSNDDGSMGNSFWDIETSGQATSDGGTGKNTTEMKDIATFSGAGWNITAVDNPSTRNPSYIWNIVDAVTYPFLSWQP